MAKKKSSEYCETCRYFRRWGDKHICANTHSEYMAEVMDRKDFCEEWKGKEVDPDD